MTAAERVTTVAGQLDEWRTAAEIAHAVQHGTSWVRWGIQHLARSQPVFCRKRTPVLMEYRIWPEAVRVVVVLVVDVRACTGTTSRGACSSFVTGRPTSSRETR